MPVAPVLVTGNVTAIFSAAMLVLTISVPGWKTMSCATPLNRKLAVSFGAVAGLCTLIPVTRLVTSSYWTAMVAPSKVLIKVTVTIAIYFPYRAKIGFFIVLPANEYLSTAAGARWRQARPRRLLDKERDAHRGRRNGDRRRFCSGSRARLQPPLGQHHRR